MIGDLIGYGHANLLVVLENLARQISGYPVVVTPDVVIKHTVGEADVLQVDRVPQDVVERAAVERHVDELAILDFGVLDEAAMEAYAEEESIWGKLAIFDRVGVSDIVAARVCSIFSLATSRSANISACCGSSLRRTWRLFHFRR